MRNSRVLLPGALLMLGLVSGCKQDLSGKESTGAVPAKVFVCGKCGQIKGSDVCCKKDQQLCSKCGLVKGSPGCCKIP